MLPLYLLVTLHTVAATMIGMARRAIVPRLDPSRATAGVAVAAGVAASILLTLSGAADSVSMIFRNTMLQASMPDAMRGRLQGLFTVVVTGGPRVGDLCMWRC